MRYLALVLTLAGCAMLLNPYQPGSRMSPELAERWGCNWAEVMGKAEGYKDGKGATESWIPQVGWDACELMARVGGPTDVDFQQTTAGRSATWWYHMDNTDAHMVSLVQRGSSWVVDYVGW